MAVKRTSFYQTKEWRAMRAKMRRHWHVNGLPCSYCGKPIDWSVRYGCIVDHIIPLRKAPHLALDESNLVCMHHECHSKKTQWSDYATKEQVGNDGYPVGSSWAE